MAGSDIVEWYLVSNTKKPIPLSPGESYDIGRDSSCAVIVVDSLISRRHCRIRWDVEEGAWVLADLASRNGTICNGEPVAGERVLRDRDLIQVGGQQFTFFMLPHGVDIDSVIAHQLVGVGSEETFELATHSSRVGEAMADIAGHVKAGGLHDLLHYLRVSGKTGMLQVDADDERRLYLDKGMPVAARSGTRTGLPALQELVERPATHFALCEHVRPDTDSLIDPTAESPLLRAAESDRVFAGFDPEDLAMAKDSQSHMLKRLPTIDGYRLSVRYEPHASVGGDFYEVGRLGDGRTLLAIGDVCRHGLQAALVVSAALRTLRMLRREHTDLLDLLDRFNAEMHAEMLPQQFLTVLAMAIDPRTGVVEQVCSGHEGAILVADGSVRVLGVSGIAVGMLDGPMYRTHLRPIGYRLEPGATVIAFTDGLLEACNAAGEIFGFDRLQSAVARVAGYEDLDRLVDALAGAVHGFADGIDDDVSLMAVLRVADEGAGDRPAE